MCNSLTNLTLLPGKSTFAIRTEKLMRHNHNDWISTIIRQLDDARFLVFSPQLVFTDLIVQRRI